MPNDLNSLGYAVEGELICVDNDWLICIDNDVQINLSKDVFPKWKNNQIRLLIANLGLLEQLIGMGMVPGEEQSFLSTLTDDQISDIIK